VCLLFDIPSSPFFRTNHTQLCAETGEQVTLAQSETLVGSVVKYDASLSSHTSQADLVLKLKAKGVTKYVRLRYAPNGFGFDAPPAKPEQLLPKELFSDGTRAWIFRVHAPHNPEEEGACTGRATQYAPGQKGLVEVERFVSVSGQESKDTPKPESLPCLIVEGWTKSADALEPKTGNLRTPAMR
jgi:hypothetical protein